MKSIFDFEALYVHRSPVDMRKSINGLAAIVVEEMKLVLKSSSLFVFCNERRTRLKILYFDRSGFALWLKRLEESKFPWPKKLEQETISVTTRDLALLLEGVNTWSRFEEVHFDHLV
jgi:transposase